MLSEDCLSEMTEPHEGVPGGMTATREMLVKIGQETTTKADLYEV